MQQNTEEKQMQHCGRGGMFRAARRCYDWFAYRLDVCVLLFLGFRILLEQDSRRLLLICNVV
jgi:hypothetical protein